MLRPVNTLLALFEYFTRMSECTKISITSQLLTSIAIILSHRQCYCTILFQTDLHVVFWNICTAFIDLEPFPPVSNAANMSQNLNRKDLFINRITFFHIYGL